jgi:hypothetical protein
MKLKIKLKMPKRRRKSLKKKTKKKRKKHKESVKTFTKTFGKLCGNAGILDVQLSDLKVDKEKTGKNLKLEEEGLNNDTKLLQVYQDLKERYAGLYDPSQNNFWKPVYDNSQRIKIGPNAIMLPKGIPDLKNFTEIEVQVFGKDTELLQKEKHEKIYKHCNIADYHPRNKPRQESDKFILSFECKNDKQSICNCLRELVEHDTAEKVTYKLEKKYNFSIYKDGNVDTFQYEIINDKSEDLTNSTLINFGNMRDGDPNGDDDEMRRRRLLFRRKKQGRRKLLWGRKKQSRSGIC